MRIGCSGWNYAGWREAFYPRGCPASRWLEFYAERLPTVEVNATFYRLPTLTATARWAEQTPPGFRFAVKVSRYLTHVKRLGDLGDGVRRFAERIEPLRDAGRLGPLLWQLPENFHLDEDRLARALDGLPAGPHAFEFRHSSWFVPRVSQLLAAHGAAFVFPHDARRPLPPPPPPSGPLAYVRLHYGARGRRGNYSAAELADWGRRLRGLRREAWVFLNNDWEAFAPRNAIGLAGFAAAR